MDETLELLLKSLLRHEAALRALPIDAGRADVFEMEERKRKIQRCERWLHLLRAEPLLTKARAGAEYRARTRKT